MLSVRYALHPSCVSDGCPGCFRCSLNFYSKTGKNGKTVILCEYCFKGSWCRFGRKTRGHLDDQVLPFPLLGRPFKLLASRPLRLSTPGFPWGMLFFLTRLYTTCTMEGCPRFRWFALQPFFCLLCFVNAFWIGLALAFGQFSIRFCRAVVCGLSDGVCSAGALLLGFDYCSFNASKL
jgi:hypothetical protein